MKIETRQFGTMVIEPEKIYTMPGGMPGFPGMKRFVILKREEIWPFYCLQCIDDSELCFYIMDPILFKADYAINLSQTAKEAGWEGDLEAIKLYVIVNTSAGVPEKITANLLGPLLIHIKRFEAVQLVLHDSNYSHQHPIFETR
ncbi:MAG: flagellar assembly protein FliW [Desulfobacterales bacterium]|nr:flagellar assembly protein FliW [Desulfobacterales bacterium]